MREQGCWAETAVQILVCLAGQAWETLLRSYQIRFIRSSDNSLISTHQGHLQRWWSRQPIMPAAIVSKPRSHCAVPTEAGPFTDRPPDGVDAGGS